MTEPRLQLAERVRLWLSFQRYALLLLLSTVGSVAGLIAWRPVAWYLWGPAALLLARPFAFGIDVWRRYPKKVRAFQSALRRLAAGSFTVDSVRKYCGDPCFRVVAREILTRAGVRRTSRRALIARFRAEMKDAERVVLLVDRANGVVVTVGAGGSVVRGAHDQV